MRKLIWWQNCVKNEKEIIARAVLAVDELSKWED